jgi:carboxyl-terminal processing protease
VIPVNKEKLQKALAFAKEKTLHFLAFAKEKSLKVWAFTKGMLQQFAAWAKENWPKYRPRVEKVLLNALPYVLVALVSVALTVSIMLGIFLPRNTDVSKLEILEQLILERFIGEADRDAMENAAADAMVGALGDRWSYYIPADEYSDYQNQMKNVYVGVGITITQMEDRSGLHVEAVADGSPAQEAGVLAGDLVVAVDGTSIAGKDISEIKSMIQGQADTKVILTVRRGEESLDISVTRREIKTVVASGQMLTEDVGYVRIVNFNRNCASETKAAIEALKAQGAKKLVFDVRNNPGGYASELVEVLDYLLPEGKLFTKVDYTGKETTNMSDAAFLDMPMAVLVNGNSYSAAEFFAAALREYDAAVVVGEKTCGKGYYQVTYELPDGSAVGLSIGKYYTPKGESLAEVGVTPDNVVPVRDELAAQIRAGLIDPANDPQVQTAVTALN